MQLKFIKKSDTHLEFFIRGERHTFPNLLKSALLKDSSVVFASYTLEHPMDNDAKFIVKTKGKTARKALEAAVKKIHADLSSFEKEVQKRIK